MADSNFIDYVKIYCRSGNGGAGSTHMRREKYIPKGERFMLTYGDGVAHIDINALLKHHDEHGKIATITAVQPPAWGIGY